MNVFLVMAMAMLRHDAHHKENQVPKEWSDEVAQPLINIVCNRPVEAPGQISEQITRNT